MSDSPEERPEKFVDRLKTSGLNAATGAVVVYIIGYILIGTVGAEYQGFPLFQFVAPDEYLILAAIGGGLLGLMVRHRPASKTELYGNANNLTWLDWVELLERWIDRLPFRSQLFLGLFCLLISVIGIEYGQRLLVSGGGRTTVLDTILLRPFGYVFSLMLPFMVASVSLISSFKKTDPTKRMDGLLRIVGAYVLIILCFTGLYYKICVSGDLVDALNKYDAYRDPTYGQELEKSGEEPRIRGTRAIDGISARMYSGVDYYATEENNILGEQYEQIPVSELRRRATEEQSKVIRFLPANRRQVLMDCLYFSIATIATVGYGDIVPRTVEAKLTANLEALSGITLLVIALAWPSWWNAQRTQQGSKVSSASRSEEATKD